jgi:hypothetical protein
MRGIKKFNVKMTNIVIAYLNALLEIYRVVLLFGPIIFLSVFQLDAAGYNSSGSTVSPFFGQNKEE